ncbi:alanine racemase [Salinivirga cyanobacteriivorans]
MQQITQPTLILDERKCKTNIAQMAHKAKDAGVEFRPHFKTHQSLEIGRWFKEHGIAKITVSSVGMAQYFATEWDDILIAFPVNVRELAAINELAVRVKLSLLVESAEVLELLHEKLTHPVSFYIKIDTGAHRTGVAPTDFASIDQILAAAKQLSKLKFVGFLSHAGHTYHTNTITDILKIRNDENLAMLQLKAHYIKSHPGIIASIGDTPSCSLVDHFSGIDEIRPGNFVFYDLMQLSFGSCSPGQIAVAVACPVVALHNERNEMVIYGGGVHLSKDMLRINQSPVYGQLVEKEGDGWGEPIPGMIVKRLSQEHGIVSLPETQNDKFTIGDLVYVLPVHSCMTADIYSQYITTDGKKIERFRHS